ncbi:MAG: response regulator transcription factor [Candidatus Didemnitutus sp.]|nr:response regulator transcription factor [Candidatus Didemnitutus sp.]
MSSRTALLIDDEAYFRRFVGEILRRNQVADVIEASDGSVALDLFKEHRPAFVLLDINMPKMDGLETLTALRRLDPDTPIIMLTSVSEEMIVEECVDLGASFFLRKDLPAHELLAKLQEVLAELFHEPNAQGQ